MHDKSMTNPGSTPRKKTKGLGRPFAIVRQGTASVPIYVGKVKGKTRYTAAFYINNRRVRCMIPTSARERGRAGQKAPRPDLHLEGGDPALPGQEEPGRQPPAELRLRPERRDRPGHARRRTARGRRLLSRPQLRLRLPHREGRKRGKTKADFFKAEQEALEPHQPGLLDDLP